MSTFWSVFVFAFILCADAQFCGLNEKYNRCGNRYERTCFEELDFNLEAPCIPGCYCKPGFVRDLQRWKCVYPSQCTPYPTPTPTPTPTPPTPPTTPTTKPPNTIVCSGNELPGCIECEITCENHMFPPYCPPDCVINGCVCPPTLVREEFGGQCVRPKYCQRILDHRSYLR